MGAGADRASEQSCVNMTMMMYECDFINAAIIILTMSIKVNNRSSLDPDSPYYRSFEEKTLEEQADEITRTLLWNEENPLFSFDSQD